MRAAQNPRAPPAVFVPDASCPQNGDAAAPLGASRQPVDSRDLPPAFERTSPASPGRQHTRDPGAGSRRSTAGPPRTRSFSQAPCPGGERRQIFGERPARVGVAVRRRVIPRAPQALSHFVACFQIRRTPDGLAVAPRSPGQPPHALQAVPTFPRGPTRVRGPCEAPRRSARRRPWTGSSKANTFPSDGAPAQSRNHVAQAPDGRVVPARVERGVRLV